MKKKILIADDEKSIADAIAYAFNRENFNVNVAYDGEEALNKIKSFKPDIVILDVMMPKLDGFDVCKRIDNRNNIGIIMLTVKNDIVDRVLGLELGADDYVVKPFDIRELIARAKSLLRRLKKSCDNESEIITIDNLKILPLQRKVSINNTTLNLTPKEFDLLLILISHTNRVYTRDELLDLIWGMDYIGGTRTVDIHIQRLRKKLGLPYGNILQTVHGVGYKALGEPYEDKY